MSSAEKGVQEIPLLTIFSLVYSLVLSGYDRKHSRYTKSQFAILAALSCREELTMSQIAENTSSARAQATRSVALLVRDGLAERFTDESNRKLVHVRLTPGGRRHIEQYLVDRYQELRDRLSEEDIARIVQSVDVLNEIFEKLHSEDA